MACSFDVIVVGGGHAGVEAAWAASQLGASTALVTMQYDAIGRMSCNPAIGGVGKGQIVREIDALGGLMGLAADRAGIQFRLLNRSKGPAVWAPRAQADRDAYPRIVQSLLAENRSVTIVEGSVEDIQTVPTSDSQASARVDSILLKDGRRLAARALVLTTGTFMRGLMHCGLAQTHGGRIGEASAEGLSRALERLGFRLGRLKTGTPPRVDRDTVDYGQCERQEGDEVPTPFSSLTDGITQPQVACWVTWTNERVHEHIRANLHRAPMYSGQIQSKGPRYCPSIEDKVVRFAEKPKHQLFLEPEGYDNQRIYCNGISTSLPRDVQDAVVREVPGLQDARILQYGYAVEYDFIPTHQATTSLETKRIRGLFIAGQLNGTSGYEEAAGQGIIAGTNAVQGLRGEPPLVLSRNEAYIGVMIDDLITRPPDEPYRMFTSRAEYRLRLRADNADERLTPIGRLVGLVDDYRWARFQRRQQELAAVEAACDRGSVAGMPIRAWMRQPDADVATLAAALVRQGGRSFCADALWQALVNAKYRGYVDRHDRQIERFRRLEALTIPPGVNYASIPHLRAEAREQWTRVCPGTLGQAGRITGITPADLTILWVHLTSRRPSAARPQ